MTILAGSDILPIELLRGALQTLQPVADDEGFLHGHLTATELNELRKLVIQTNHLLSHRDTRLLQGRPHNISTVPAPQTSLLDCITELAQGRKCTNRHDLVYAMLGLTNNILGITPNYDTLSVDSVFQDLTTRCLLSGDASALHESGRGSDDDSEKISFVPILARSNKTTLRLDKLSSGFCAGSQFPLKITSFTDRVLSLCGVEVDTITKTLGFKAPTLRFRIIALPPIVRTEGPSGGFEGRKSMEQGYLDFRKRFLGHDIHGEQ